MLIFHKIKLYLSNCYNEFNEFISINWKRQWIPTENNTFEMFIAKQPIRNVNTSLLLHQICHSQKTNIMSWGPNTNIIFLFKSTIIIIIIYDFIECVCLLISMCCDNMSLTHTICYLKMILLNKLFIGCDAFGLKSHSKLSCIFPCVYTSYSSLVWFGNRQCGTNYAKHLSVLICGWPTGFYNIFVLFLQFLRYPEWTANEWVNFNRNGTKKFFAK